MDNVADWEMARALYADTFQYPIDKAAEWTKLIEGPNWIQAEGFKRMARRCREALEARNLQIVNRTPDLDGLVAKMEARKFPGASIYWDAAISACIEDTRNHFAESKAE